MTDDELNAALAIEVMTQPGQLYAGGSSVRIGFSPATDIADAFEVVDKMKADVELFLRFWHELTVAAYRQSVPGSLALHCGDAAVLFHMTPRAICEAALAAVRNYRAK